MDAVFPIARRRVLNPLRSEAEAFRLLVYAVVVFLVVVGLIVILRAIF